MLIHCENWLSLVNFLKIRRSYFLRRVDDFVSGAKAPDNWFRQGVDEAPALPLEVVLSFLLVVFFILGLLIDDELEDILMLHSAH